MKYVDVKVTREPDGYHYTIHSQFGTGPVIRNGKPFKSEKPFADGWEAMTAGHSAIASYDREASYIVEELREAEFAAERLALKLKMRAAKGKDNAARKAA